MHTTGDEYDEGNRRTVYPNPDTRVMLSNVDMMALLVVFAVPRKFSLTCVKWVDVCTICVAHSAFVMWSPF